jgi:RHS repeat-associated protein
VRYIRDYLNGSTVNPQNHWTEIEVWGTTTTAYVGDYFEWNGSAETATRYYYAGGTRVAMRNGIGTGTNGLVYLLSDHLGSTSLTADPLDGDKLSELIYKAWGETRYALTSIPTDRRYTGQVEEAGIGLYYYGARFYDPSLSRFISADSIIPGTRDVQAWDRYAAMGNNPVKYVDPTGHMQACPDGDLGAGCGSEGQIPQKIKNGNKSNPKTQISTKLSYVALGLDASAAFLSDLEMVAVDYTGITTIAACCATVDGCLPAIGVAWAVDFGVTTVSPLGVMENFLGGGSFIATMAADLLSGNTGLTSGGLSVGNDTLVAGRNLIAGLVPEANVDALVSNSQLKYDLDRLLGNKPSGSVMISRSTDFKNLFLKLLLDDWW